MSVAIRIKIARKECKLTQQQVADVLGIDRSTYSYYELGTFNPSVEILVKLASIYNVELQWLATGCNDEDAWKDSEYDLNIIKTVKEKSITDLSKEERKFVALLRAARAARKDADIFSALMNICSGENNEN